ncbi:acyl-CoA carboxylase subunit beta [Tropheryma whipplei]|uniref:acyl-CoA carboxylase subunit beta n=1 Tax=Tropheryma whipplei TaxID=2039 RepID=UPI0004B93531|nr:acyl-CoA carboxylase subunit beta [Tropheryma whipplei]
MTDNFDESSRGLEKYRQAYEVAVTLREDSAKEKQHSKGKMTARERIDKLLDENSFTEIDQFAMHSASGFGIEKNHPYGDSVVTGFGSIDGRKVAVYSQDFTVFGGSLGEVAGRKIVKTMDLAMSAGIPVIGLLDSGGARIQEGIAALTKYGEIFKRNVAASGIIPQISIVMGPAAGGACYSPALTDFVIMVDQISYMFITGPDVIKAVTGEEVTFEDLGGANMHNATSGVSHYMAHSEDDAIAYARELIGFLPSNNMSDPPTWPQDIHTEESDLELNSIVPENPNKPYDMQFVIERIVDEGNFLEIQSAYAKNVIIGFARISGFSIGIVANQPAHMAGALDINASEKAARFVRFCDAFSIPILTLVDVPGYLPGTEQEWTGIIRRGAKLLYAYSEATVPMVTIILRKAYGGAYIVMGSKALGADINLAWPSAEIAVMGAQGAVNILYRNDIKRLVQAGEDANPMKEKLVKEYTDKFANPFIAAQRGYLDAIIEPAQTRIAIATAFQTIRTKRYKQIDRKHGSIPL